MKKPGAPRNPTASYRRTAFSSRSLLASAAAAKRYRNIRSTSSQSLTRLIALHPCIVRRAVQNPRPLKPLQLPRIVVDQIVRPQNPFISAVDDMRRRNKRKVLLQPAILLRKRGRHLHRRRGDKHLVLRAATAASPAATPASPPATRKNPPTADKPRAHHAGRSKPPPTATSPPDRRSSAALHNRGYNAADAQPPHPPSPHPYRHNPLQTSLTSPHPKSRPPPPKTQVISTKGRRPQRETPTSHPRPRVQWPSAASSQQPHHRDSGPKRQPPPRRSAPTPLPLHPPSPRHLDRRPQAAAERPLYSSLLPTQLLGCPIRTRFLRTSGNVNPIPASRCHSFPRQKEDQGRPKTRVKPKIP